MSTSMSPPQGMVSGTIRSIQLLAPDPFAAGSFTADRHAASQRESGLRTPIEGIRQGNSFFYSFDPQDRR
jgi:hypothetical protein